MHGVHIANLTLIGYQYICMLKLIDVKGLLFQLLYGGLQKSARDHCLPRNCPPLQSFMSLITSLSATLNLCEAEVFTELFYAFIPTLLPCFLLIGYPYISLHCYCFLVLFMLPSLGAGAYLS